MASACTDDDDFWYSEQYSHMSALIAMVEQNTTSVAVSARPISEATQHEQQQQHTETQCRQAAAIDCPRASRVCERQTHTPLNVTRAHPAR